LLDNPFRACSQTGHVGASMSITDVPPADHDHSKIVGTPGGVDSLGHSGWPQEFLENLVRIR
jgi:hypothetical protein